MFNPSDSFYKQTVIYGDTSYGDAPLIDVSAVPATTTAPAGKRRTKRATATATATAATTTATAATTTATAATAARVTGLSRHAAYQLRGKRALISRLRNEAKRLATTDPALSKATKRQAANEQRLINRQLTSIGLPLDYKA